MNNWSPIIAQPSIDHYLLPKKVRYILKAPYIPQDVMQNIGQMTSMLLELSCSLPDRIFRGSYEKMSDYLGYRKEQKEIFIKLNEKIESDVFARSDLVRIGNQWKLHELNVGSNLLTNLAVSSLPNISGFEQEFNALGKWAQIITKKWNFGKVFAFVIPKAYLEEAKVVLQLFIPQLKKMADQKFLILCEEDLIFKENRLEDHEEHKIDFVYPLFNEHSIESAPTQFAYLLKAISCKVVLCPMGPTYSLVSNKGILALLWELVGTRLLSSAETDLVEAFVPKTVWVTKENFPFILENKNNLVLKPINYFQGINVWAGSEMTKEKWSILLLEILSGSKNDKYVAQEFVPAEINSILISDGHQVIEENSLLTWGIYVFGNTLLGGMVRGRPTNSSVIFKAIDPLTYYGPLSKS